MQCPGRCAAAPPFLFRLSPAAKSAGKEPAEGSGFTGLQTSIWGSRPQARALPPSSECTPPGREWGTRMSGGRRPRLQRCRGLARGRPGIERSAPHRKELRAEIRILAFCWERVLCLRYVRVGETAHLRRPHLDVAGIAHRRHLQMIAARIVEV